MAVSDQKTREVPAHEENRKSGVQEFSSERTQVNSHGSFSDAGISAGVEHLRLKFPEEPDIFFHHLTLHIPKGQKVLILGPSGSGKSTLLQVLSGLIPNSIEVPMKYSRIQLPASWGFVFQDPDTQFCMPFVDEELAFVLENQKVPRREMESRMREALGKVGLSFEHLHIPIQQLSQGMKQRLALASVLLLKPETVFLDEPSALLDPEGTGQIWTSIKQALNDRTVIVVEHKIDAIVDWIDRIVMLDEQGRLIADGKPEDVFRDHKAELVRYGIWYPSVWEEYLASPGWQAICANRRQSGLSEVAGGGHDPLQENRQETVGAHSPLHPQPERNESSIDGAQSYGIRPDNTPVVELEQFEAYRGKQCKLRIEKASIDERSWIAVTGENGAGKSTLLLALTQLIPTAGKYVLRGKTIPENPKKRRVPEGVSLVFQNPEMQMVTDSLYDELALSLSKAGLSHDEIAEEAERLLRYFRLNLDPRRHPYDLSLGQKRRLSVATALAAQASVLLLDEPTFGQDARNTFALLEYMEQLRVEGKTIVMVTHDRRVVDHFATEEWVIEKGRLKEIRKIWRS